MARLVVGREAGPGSAVRRTAGPSRPFGGGALVRAAEAPRRSSHYSAAMAARPTWRSLALDVGPVVALTLVALVMDYGERFRSPMPTLVFVVVPLLLRRYAPLAVLLFVALGTLLTAADLTVLMMHRYHAYRTHPAHHAANRTISGPPDYSQLSPSFPSRRASCGPARSGRSGLLTISLNGGRRG